MGNTVAGSEGRSGGKKKVKVMKINGEFFKLNTPVKAKEVTKDYPGHILLDSKEFLRYNLRGSQPLEPESDLLPGHIYLLVQLPEFPTVRTSLDNINSSLPRTRSSGGESSNRSNLSKLYRRSVSDLVVAGDVESSGALRMKLKLPKVEVERIMEQSVDKAEVARRIFGLSSRMDDAGNRDEGRQQQRQLEAVARLW